MRGYLCHNSRVIREELGSKMGCVGSKEKPATPAARPATTTTASAAKTKEATSNHADVPEGDENRLDADCTYYH